VRIFTKRVLDLETLQWIVELDESFEYEGPVAQCGGGDPTAQANEQLQNQFDQQLMGIFNNQYQNQTGILNFVKSQIEPMVQAGGTGYTPAQLTSLRTGATDTNAEAYQQAQAALNEQTQQASGGSKLTGVAGATSENIAALDNAEAQTNAASQESITQADANLAQQNYWAGINTLAGNAAEVNPLGYSSAVQNGATAVSSDSKANSESQATSPLNEVLGAVGGAAGGLFGAAGKAGGFSSLFS
jgi:hypothetical protein